MPLFSLSDNILKRDMSEVVASFISGWYGPNSIKNNVGSYFDHREYM